MTESMTAKRLKEINALNKTRCEPERVYEYIAAVRDLVNEVKRLKQKIEELRTVPPVSNWSDD